MKRVPQAKDRSLGMSEKIVVHENDEFSVVSINTDHESATISLQGAQLLEWKPVNNENVIWVSEVAQYKKGKSIRGGIPICWPWFGFHDAEPDYPIHGFARTQPWELLSAKELADGSVALGLRLAPHPEVQKFWPFKAELTAVFTIGKTLNIRLTSRNVDNQPIVIGEALHTYFSIGDIDQTIVRGLDGCSYYDKVDAFKLKEQNGDIKIDQEVDRVYRHAADTGEATCIIEDQALKRQIRITKRGSQATVIWNPWIDKSLRMGDMGDNGYRTMICVETANAMDGVVTIQPGASHSMEVEYTVTML